MSDSNDRLTKLRALRTELSSRIQILEINQREWEALRLPNMTKPITTALLSLESALDIVEREIRSERGES